jgi:hypothetical protein
MHAFIRRVLGAMRLDAATFEEIEADRRALGQSGLVVLAFSVAAGVGLSGAATPTRAIPMAVLGSLAGWLSWAALVYYIGSAMPEARTRVDIGELARTLGFSAAPGLLLGPAAWLTMPWLRLTVFALVALWMLAAMIVAVRQALDFTRTWRATAVCVIGWCLAALIVVVGGVAFGPVLF